MANKKKKISIDWLTWWYLNYYHFYIVQYFMFARNLRFHPNKIFKRDKFGLWRKKITLEELD